MCHRLSSYVTAFTTCTIPAAYHSRASTSTRETGSLIWQVIQWKLSETGRSQTPNASCLLWIIVNRWRWLQWTLLCLTLKAVFYPPTTTRQPLPEVTPGCQPYSSGTGITCCCRHFTERHYLINWVIILINLHLLLPYLFYQGSYSNFYLEQNTNIVYIK